MFRAMVLQRSRSSLARWLFALPLAALVVAACGSDDGVDSEPGQTTVAAAIAEEEPTAPEASGESDQSDEPAPDSPSQPSAVVTVGSDTYELGGGEYDSCQMTEDEIFKANLSGERGEGFINLQVSLPPDGLDPSDLSMPWDAYPHVTVTVGESEWEANAYESSPESTNNRNIPEGTTQVDSFQLSASGASGTATFLDMEDLTYDQDTSSYSGDPVMGSFEVSCG